MNGLVVKAERKNKQKNLHIGHKIFKKYIYKTNWSQTHGIFATHHILSSPVQQKLYFQYPKFTICFQYKSFCQVRIHVLCFPPLLISTLHCSGWVSLLGAHPPPKSQHRLAPSTCVCSLLNTEVQFPLHELHSSPALFSSHL